MKQWIETVIYEMKRRRAYLIDRSGWPVKDRQNCIERVKKIDEAIAELYKLLYEKS